jgi:hypothetical protein
MNDSFVYCWSDRETAKVYVGVHKGMTDDGYICSSKPMMAQYRERPTDFTRQIIATGTLNDCAVLEVAIIKQLLKVKDTCYNRGAGKMIINDVHPMLGRSNKEGSKKASATVLRKMKEDPEYARITKENRSNAKLGKPSPRKGVKLSEETKQKISKNNYWNGKVGVNAGKKFSAEYIKKLSESHKGQIVSVETRKKLSDAAKKQWELVRAIRSAKENPNGR